MKDNLKLLIFVVFLGVIFPAIIITDRYRSDLSVTEPNSGISDSIDISVQNLNSEVITIDLDDYLVSVVLCEMPVEFSVEALKAQAVVARTYTLRRVEKGGKHTGFQVCMDATCCQGFKGVDEFLGSGGTVEGLNKVKEAVDSTKNYVLTYDGELIEATYFSCSGGSTEDAVAVWGKDVPYLQATLSPGEESATHYTDEVRYNAKEFSELLGCTSDKPPVAWIESISYTEGGGVDKMTICGKTFSGVELRSALNLRSTAMTLSVLEDIFVITTRGFGHRVGMSQYGAEAMALDGSAFADILCHYYKGVTLSQYNRGD